MKVRFRPIRRVVTFVSIAALLVALVIGTQTQDSKILEGQAHISDGDSVRIDRQRVRLVGIDAPELQQNCLKQGAKWACGQAAKQALAAKINGKPISCVGEKFDQYRRLLAICYLGEEDINAWLVREGWAVSYHDYAIDEVLARRDQRGIWASEFTAPHQWRSR